MHYTPHPYQNEAIEFLLTHPKAALFLDMGLGKTSITLTALNELLANGVITHPLIIAPLRVAQTTWSTEIATWDHLTHLTAAIMVGSPAQRRHALRSNADIHIINRENVPWLVEELDGLWPYDAVVIDELSSFKSHASKRFKALAKVLPSSCRMIGLTGTPSPNGLGDLYAQFRLLDGGQRLGRTVSTFRSTYFIQNTHGGHFTTYEPRQGAQEAIYEAISDITLSMQAKDHLRLPQAVFVTHKASLPPEANTTYRDFARDMITQLGGETIDAASAGVLVGKLAQLASGTLYREDKTPLVVHDAKLDMLDDLVEAANGSPVMIAYWYKTDQQRICERLKSLKPRVLRTPADMRAWNEGRVRVALLHPASAGHGLNLQAGGHILIWFTPVWSLELYQQTNARLNRQGQTHPVSIHHIIAEGTVDEQIMSALERKDVGQSALISAVKNSVTGDSV